MIFLANDRYNPRKDSFGLSVGYYPTRYQNYMKGKEILEEMHMESLRAP